MVGAEAGGEEGDGQAQGVNRAETKQAQKPSEVCVAPPPRASLNAPHGNAAWTHLKEEARTTHLAIPSRITHSSTHGARRPDGLE